DDDIIDYDNDDPEDDDLDATDDDTDYDEDNDDTDDVLPDGIEGQLSQLNDDDEDN
ncbi:DNA-directed RNA polymerase subunit delta, partial [Lactobacillus crispatus]|nr:DNA-directed RNA polymerase subunit delta [Lactobacillus crispatus]